MCDTHSRTNRKPRTCAIRTTFTHAMRCDARRHTAHTALEYSLVVFLRYYNTYHSQGHELETVVANRVAFVGVRFDWFVPIVPTLCNVARENASARRYNTQNVRLCVRIARRERARRMHKYVGERHDRCRPTHRHSTEIYALARPPGHQHILAITHSPVSRALICHPHCWSSRRIWGEHGKIFSCFAHKPKTSVCVWVFVCVCRSLRSLNMCHTAAATFERNWGANGMASGCVRTRYSVVCVHS